jgi:hypothetical protein
MDQASEKKNMQRHCRRSPEKVAGVVDRDHQHHKFRGKSTGGLMKLSGAENSPGQLKEVEAAATLNGRAPPTQN